MKYVGVFSKDGKDIRMQHFQFQLFLLTVPPTSPLQCLLFVKDRRDVMLHYHIKTPTNLE